MRQGSESQMGLEFVRCDGIVMNELDLPVRPRWSDVFGREAPIELEIGIGNGEFIVSMASSNSEHNFVGVELSSRYLSKAVNRVRTAGLKNVRLILGEGGLCLSKLFSPSSIHAIYINFPDPWEKPRHSHRRLVDEPFVCLVASRLIFGGTFTMVTDSYSYATSVRELMSSINVFEPASGSDGLCAGVPEGFMTKYYRKWTALQRSIWTVSFIKTSHYDLPEWVSSYYPLAHLEASLPMPHVVIAGEIVNWSEVAQKIETGIWVHQPQLVIKCDGIYTERDGKGMLFSLLCVEGKMQQRLFVYATSHHGETVVRVHPACRLNVTAGIQLTVGITAQMLMRLNKLERLLRSNLGEQIHRKLGWDV
jgi:tRNA (guanine-N7-)-methyltransferase